MSDAYDGFLRALAVVMATRMPQIPLKKKPASASGSAALSLFCLTSFQTLVSQSVFCLTLNFFLSVL